jgi:hypothetical protein
MLLRSSCIVLTSTVLLAQSYSPRLRRGLRRTRPVGSSVPIRYSQIYDDAAIMITGMAFPHYYQFTTLIYPVR